MNAYWFERILSRLDEKLGHRAISRVPLGIVVLNAIVWLLYQTRPDYLGMLTLNITSVLEGQLWRLVTFLFIPPAANFLLIFFALYFLYICGTGLEAAWGSFRLNIYYLIGMLSTILIACFFPHTHVTNAYLNMTIFLAFSMLYPDFKLYLFFIIPVKVKYLAVLTWIFLAFQFFLSPFWGKLMVCVSVLNYVLFFWPDIVLRVKNIANVTSGRQFGHVPQIFHRCAACGKADADDDNETFRVCPECSGGKEYCERHIDDHQHA